MKLNLPVLWDTVSSNAQIYIKHILEDYLNKRVYFKNIEGLLLTLPTLAEQHSLVTAFDNQKRFNECGQNLGYRKSTNFLNNLSLNKAKHIE